MPVSLCHQFTQTSFLITTILYAMQISDINFQPLLDVLQGKLEITDLKVEPDWSRPRIISPNLAIGKCGVFGYVFSSVTVDFFNFSDDGVGGYWMTVDLYYEHMDGGTNGVKLCSAWVNDDNQWTVKFV